MRLCLYGLLYCLLNCLLYCLSNRPCYSFGPIVVCGFVLPRKSPRSRIVESNTGPADSFSEAQTRRLSRKHKAEPIGNTIGNSIQQIRISPIPLLQIFRICYNCFRKRASTILKETYIRSTYITDQTNFIENCQNCKQFGKKLDTKKTKTSPDPKTDFLGSEN